MNLRIIGTCLLLITTTTSAQQGAGAQPSAGNSRDFQDAVLAAPNGATLFADDYRPRLKVNIEIPNGKSLTIVGGLFTTESALLPALGGGNWAAGVRLVRSSFVRGGPDAPARVSLGAYRVELEGCYIEGTVDAWNALLLTDCFIHPGAREFARCDVVGPGWPEAGVTAHNVAIRGGVLRGIAGVTKPSSCGCGWPFQPGGPAVYASGAVVLYESAPALILGAPGETVDGCSTTGAFGEKIIAPRTIVLD